MTSPAKPVFWRDARMPYVELRQVGDGRQVCYAPHSHTQWSLGAITAGKSTYLYRDESYLVSAGDLVLVNPEWVHACNPVDNQAWAYLMLYIDTGWLTDLRHKAGLLDTPCWQDISRATLSDKAWYERYLRVAECLLDSRRDLLDKQTTVIGFLSDLMHELTGQSERCQPQVPQTLKELAAYLDRHAVEDIALEDLCDFSGYSAGHLIRSFKQYFGLTPHAYLINRRIQLGRLALKNGAPIVEAALNAGFADQPHFQRAFKRLMAATPNQYRLPSSAQQIDATGRE